MSRLQEALQALQQRTPRPPPRQASAPLSTGVAALDAVLGTGGWPRGRLVEVFGDTGVGKTTLALHAARSCQRLGLAAAILDMERGLDARHPARLGLDPERLLLCRPEGATAALAIATRLAASGGVGLVILDSADMLEEEPALLDALRRLESAAWRGQAAVIIVDQLRPRPELRWGTGEETPRGRDAIKFVAVQRVELRWRGPLRGFAAKEGHRLRARVVQNHFAPPERVAALRLLYASGAMEGDPTGSP